MPAYDYDLSSAFPRIAMELVDIRQCDIVKSTEYQEKAVYGYCKGVVTIYDWVQVHPIAYVDERGEVSFKTGTWPAYQPKCAIDFINKWGIGEFRLDNGWWFIPKNGVTLTKPLEGPMEEMLAYKARGGLAGQIAKRVCVGIYGKEGQAPVNKNVKDNFLNPVWFAEISTQARLQVAEELYKLGIGPDDNEGYRHLLQVTVDGFMLDEAIPEGKLDEHWRLDNVSPVLIVNGGLVFALGKRPQGLALMDVLAMIKAHPRQTFYKKIQKRRVTLAEAVNLGLDKLGTEIGMYTGFNLLTQKYDRAFTKIPRSGGALLRGLIASGSLKTK